MEENNSIVDEHRLTIRRTYTRLSKELKNWAYCPESTSAFIVYQSGGYVKQECIIRCPLSHVFTMLSDKSMVTRRYWDKAQQIEQMEEFRQQDDGIIFTVKRDGYVGLQWERQNALIVFKKCYDHPLYKSSSSNGVDVEFLIWFQSWSNDGCFVTTISTMMMNVSVLTPKMVVAMESANYMKIYSPWSCKPCNRSTIPPNELYCRICDRERYGRCKDPKCYEAQEEGATRCKYCSGEVLCCSQSNKTQ